MHSEKSNNSTSTKLKKCREKNLKSVENIEVGNFKKYLKKIIFISSF